MTKYLAGVLSVIAVGVMLVAYGLLAPRAAASYAYPDQYGMPTAYPYSTQYGNPPPFQYPSAPAVATPISDVRVVQTVTEEPVRRYRTVRPVSRAPRRDWKKTAIVIGGSSAAGAGIGAIIGGKKGALIGTAIGGGASALYETRK